MFTVLRLVLFTCTLVFLALAFASYKTALCESNPDLCTLSGKKYEVAAVTSQTTLSSTHSGASPSRK